LIIIELLCPFEPPLFLVVVDILFLDISLFFYIRLANAAAVTISTPAANDNDVADANSGPGAGPALVAAAAGDAGAAVVVVVVVVVGATYLSQQTASLAASSAPDSSMVEALGLSTIFNGHPQLNS
jgi:hypothetical protein